MARRQVPVTITYRKPGTLPPVFVAGSFSDPAWQPYEMIPVANDHGEYTFERVVTAKEGAEIQYKFRIGAGDWWALKEDAETVSDDQGNVNNLMKLPRVMPETSLDIPEEVVIEEDEWAEDSSPSHSPLFSHERPADFDHCPMFSHECPESVEESETGVTVREHQEGTDSQDQDCEDIDYDDPLLERFPSNDTKSILATLRQIETSTDEDHTVVEGIPPSPIVSASSKSPSISSREAPAPRLEARSDSMESIRLGRSSRVSLQSIAESSEEGDEEDENDEVKGKPAASSFPEAVKATIVSQAGPMSPIVTLETPSSEDDEGIAMSTAGSKSSVTGILRKRNVATSTDDDRPASRASLQSIREMHKSGNWLHAFFRTLFVDWIGGWFSRIFHTNRRKALLAAGTAAFVVGILWRTWKGRTQ